MCSGFCDALRGTGPRATGTRAFFSVPCEGQALALRAAPGPCRSGSPDLDPALVVPKHLLWTRL